MMPEWKDAPLWANWLSMTENGDWWWSEEKPEWSSTTSTSSGMRPRMNFHGRNEPAGKFPGYIEARNGH